MQDPAFKSGVWGGRSGALAAAAVLLALGFSSTAPAATKGAMEIGLGGRYVWPQWDLAHLEPAFVYNLTFEYWLNTTTTVVAQYDQMSFVSPLEVNHRTEDLRFNTGVLTGGARYRPKLDLWIQPYLEAGLGYQNWNTNSDLRQVKSRSGSSIAYYAAGGLEYEFRHSLIVGLDVRYLFTPMKENLETSVTGASGNWEVRQDPLKEAGYLSAGVQVVWKFR